MNLILDSFWRAVAYCLRPGIILLSLLPLLFMMGLTVGLGYLFWEPAMDQVMRLMESSAFLNGAWQWLEGMGAGKLKTVIAPLIVIFAVTPLIVIVSMLVVALAMSPVMVRLVVRRRFAHMQAQHGASFLRSVLWSLGSTALALVAMVVSMPLWLVPPLVLILPPLIWGWLTYRVMAFDALANHATEEERQTIFREHRIRLLGMGIFAGYLGAAPTLVWASGVVFAAAFVILLPMAIWIYTLVFAFSSRESGGVMNFGLVIIGDEILSGKRADKHLAKAIEILGVRGLQVAYADYVGDAPERITATLHRAFASGDVVFSFGGIGATPDDHTRQCAGKALERALVLHPRAEALIRERMQDVAREQGTPYEPDRADNVHRLNMGVYPAGAEIIPNPYNKIPGFSIFGVRGGVHFLPGFPVMAWPMMEWVLDTHYAGHFRCDTWIEQSVIVFGAMESMLTPLMEDLERRFALKVFSLPSVDHPEHGRHIELGVKGDPAEVARAYPELLVGLRALNMPLGPELVRK
jgi:molybdopterin-biosynthesis enzyme MoeA-like protein